MLAQLARRQLSAARTGLPAAAAALQQQRGIKLFELFSKEKREERKRKLKEEMEQGYFDDFRDFRDKGGKVFAAPDRLVPASHAPAFPRLPVLRPDGSAAEFPPPAAAAAAAAASSSASSPAAAEGGGAPSSSSAASSAPPAAAASLVCVGFRAGAQPMIEAWASAFAQRFAGVPGAALVELSLVEGVVMRLPPFRQMLLREGGKQGDKYAMPVSYLFHFGGTEELRAALAMTNRLTGYVYLVDARGRLRWRGSGAPDAQELATLLRCTEELLAAAAPAAQQPQAPAQPPKA